MTSLTTPHTDALSAVHDMSIDDLRREYIALKNTGYSLSVEESHLKDKIEVLREESVRTELNAEVREEQMSNQLFRRLDGAEKEVQRYKAMLKEEENAAETLTARIKQMRSEKNEVENVLEERQEYLLMNLQRKLLETARKKTWVEQELMLERQRYLDVLVTRLDALRGRSNSGSSDFTVTTTTTTQRGNSAAASPAAAEKSTDATPAAAAASASGAGTTGVSSSPAAESNPPRVATPEKAAPAEDAAAATTTAGAPSPAPPLKSPYASFSQGSRSGLASTPRSGDVTPLSSHSSETHQIVVTLERKLNQLLLEQAAAMQRTSATEKQCAELGAKLRSVQEATFLYRARAAKLKEELKEVRARLVDANSNTSFAATNMSVCGDSSFDESLSASVNPRSFDPAVSLSMSNLSLRERTRELLSSIPPPTMN